MDSFDAVEDKFVIRVDSLLDILSSFWLAVIDAVRGVAAVLVLAVPVDMLASVLCCFIDLCEVVLAS